MKQNAGAPVSRDDMKMKAHPQEILFDFDAVGQMILDAQRDTGEIPWCDGDKTDPWDMVEAIIGLQISGHFEQAEKAYSWLASQQLENGSWYAAYKNGEPEDKTQDTNMSSYIAVGAYHHYLSTGDTEFLKKLWPMVKGGLDFAVRLQAPGGEIHWASSPEGVVDPMALLTGSSSVYMSLKCGVMIGRVLSMDVSSWEKAAAPLCDSLRNRRHVYNVAKSRFSMDWFYPILSGAVTGEDATRRLKKYWKKYMVEDMGVRCVSDQPWVTVAETSELVLALDAMGNRDQARIVFDWIQGRYYEDGTYWCGFTFPDMVIWPEEKLTWTNAVVLMAADALYGLTPAGHLFRHDFWQKNGFK